MRAIEKRFKKLIEYLSTFEGRFDIAKIKKAFELAKASHEGQKRESGEPYISHPVEVAVIVSEFGLDTDSIISALLHDIIEDTPVTYEEVKKEFGEDVASIVDGVTKLGKIPYSSKEEEQMENLRKMFLAMAKDIRVIMVKLADRLHNMRTLDSKPEQKRRDTALETMEVFAPLAHRLGMQKVKVELEDICLRYLDPVGYEGILTYLKENAPGGEKFINEIKKTILEKLKDYNVKFHIESRIKHAYSIYRKVFTQHKTIEEIYDLYALRIIVDHVNDCYYVLGLIHEAFNPIPGRFKDYISTPKPNMYQSLHTTVIGKEGVPFEVQIRTWEMHNIAEYGIAAHWKYKHGITKGKEDFDLKLQWVRNLLEMQEETNDAEDFIRSLKIDMFADEVFVFTPNGDVVNLPMGATVIDFAYAIHSAVGNKMVGAKVNGKIVPLDYKISNGEIIEVLTTSAQNHGPSRDWLNIAKTSSAKSKIRQWFKREKRDENIQNGIEEIERNIKRLDFRLKLEDKNEILESIAKKLHFADKEDLFAAVGYGGVSAVKIITRFKDEALKLKKELEPLGDTKIILKEPKASDGGVIVEGIDNCLVKFARCCNPLPGDPIIGFITKGFGVSVHKKDCLNVIRNQDKEPERWLAVRWDKDNQKHFSATISIFVQDSVGIMAKIASMLADMKVSIHAINAKDKDDNAIITLTFDVKDVNHLNYIVNKLSKIREVISITRTNS